MAKRSLQTTQKVAESGQARNKVENSHANGDYLTFDV